ncbi:serine hydrolase [Streptomyces sp. NPDC002308]
MAGESLGKSERSKSSGTAPEERDPRLSVFRETAGPTDDTVGDAADDAPGSGTDTEPGTDAASGTGTDAASGTDAEPGTDAEAEADAREDTATAVFRFRVPVPPAADAAEEADEAADTADEAADADAPERAEGATNADAAEDGAAETPEGPTEPSGADSAPSGASGAQEPATSAPAADADADAADDETAQSETAKSETAESGTTEGDGDKRLRRAVAAWVAEGDSPAAAEKPAGATESAEPSKDDTPSKDDKPDADTAGAQVPRSREEAAPTEPASAAKVPGPSGETDEPAEAASDAKGKSGSDDKSGPGDKSDADGNSGADEDGDDADDAGIDQPTAVFKSVRPRIDQPTTALKIPKREALAKQDSEPDPKQDTKPDTKPAPGDASAPKASKPGSESDSERTSTFVPLRSDDVRSAPAPRRPAPQGPVVGPTVTPALGTSTTSATSSATSTTGEPDRTRSLPLPPRPPLDLLAELTNTPPPAETPVRTAVRRVKIWTPLVLLVLIIFAVVQMVRPLPDPTLSVTAKPTYTFDGAAPDLSWPSQGQGYMAATGLGEVGSFGKQKPVPIASVAKAMTAYIVLKDHPMKKGEDGASIKVDAKGESDGKLSSEGESTLDTVKEGDVLTQRDALSAIMIPSANNIARLLARWDAGSEKAFVEKMNATAKELGMTNTTYTDPSGLDATTVSTAEDLVKLGEKLVEIPALMEITILPSWTDPTGKPWPNYNRLVPFNGALGIKTGSTTKAGGNLLFAAHKMIDGTDQLIVGAILGQYDSQSIIDEVNRVSKTVMLATEDALKGATIVKKGQVVGVVDDGLGSTTPVVATKDVKAVGWGGLTVKLELTDDGKAVPHEATAGTEVGTLTVGEGTSQVKVPVALAQDLSEPGFGAKLSRIG